MQAKYLRVEILKVTTQQLLKQMQRPKMTQANENMEFYIIKKKKPAAA